MVVEESKYYEKIKMSTVGKNEWSERGVKVG